MTLSQSIDISPDALFFALTNAPALQEWLADEVRLEPKSGGRFQFWWRQRDALRGTVAQLVPNESLTLRWGDSAGEDVRASFVLRKIGGGTRLELTLAGADADTAEMWRNALKNLTSVLETGIDQRQARRPFLGIGGGAVTPALAGALGVPVNAGFRVQNVVDGSGAAEAGLAPDDVLVRVGNRPVTDGASLQTALAGVQVGDTLPVTFYRGPVQMTVDISITPLPQPPLPAGPAELADRVRALYAEFEQALTEMVNGAPAEAFEYRPAPDAWTARELLAHLIIVERWGHHYLTLRVAGQPQGGYANDPRVHAAVSQAYGDIFGLLAELRRAQETTTAALGDLPASLFTDRRGAVASITNTFTVGMPFHTRTHIAEIRHRLAAVRDSAELAELADRK